MEQVINYRKIQEELAKTCKLSEKCSAIVSDILSGEIVAVNGELSHAEAANLAGSFHVIWNSQDDTAAQHDDKLESLMISNQDRNNYLIFISNAKKTTEGGFLLALSTPLTVEFGTLKVN